MCASTFIRLSVLFCIVSIVISTGRLYVLSKFSESGEAGKLSRNLWLTAMMAIAVGVVFGLVSRVVTPC